MGYNDFTDLTDAEFRARFTGLKLVAQDASISTDGLAPLSPDFKLPTSVDWCAKGENESFNILSYLFLTVSTP